MSEVKETAAVQGSQSKPLRRLAMVVSYVFHPVFMPTIMAIVLYMLAHDTLFPSVAPKAYHMWIIIIALNTIMFPLITVALLKGLGFIKSIHMTDPKDRIIPLIACMVFYFWANHALGGNPDPNLQIPLMLHTLTLGSFWGIIALFMVSIFFKISMHAAAAGGMLGILLVLMFASPVNMAMPLFIGLLIAGIIGTARMILGVHKIWDIWLGYLLGIAVQVAAYLYLR
jgi:nitrate reductase NapE component